MPGAESLLKLAREGWLVSGVDASAGMLRAARASAAEAGLRAAFRRGDMRSFRIPARFSVITCMFDSLNHLGSAAELRSAFRRVAAHLEPGGWFIFDINALRCFELLWTSTQTIEHRDFTLILKTSYDARRRTGTAFVTLFERDGKAFGKSTEVVPGAVVLHRRGSAGSRVGGTGGGGASGVQLHPPQKPSPKRSTTPTSGASCIAT